MDIDICTDCPDSFMKLDSVSGCSYMGYIYIGYSWPKNVSDVLESHCGRHLRSCLLRPGPSGQGLYHLIAGRMNIIKKSSK